LKQRRDLFSEIDLVFFDTTSLYFEGEGGQEIGRYGKSKDHRPDLKQMVVGWRWTCTVGRCAVNCGRQYGRCHHAPAGGESIATRFRVRRVCIVADRGMISAGTMRALESEELDCDYILGARMRSVKEVSDRVLADRGHYREITPERKTTKDPSP